MRLTGADRTKFIDASVIRVKRKSTCCLDRRHRVLFHFFPFLEAAPTSETKTQWPELVGQTGEQAVKIIKQETGQEQSDVHLVVNIFI